MMMIGATIQSMAPIGVVLLASFWTLLWKISPEDKSKGMNIVLGLVPLAMVVIGFFLLRHTYLGNDYGSDNNFYYDHLVYISQITIIVLFTIISLGSLTSWRRAKMKFRESSALMLFSLIGALVLCGSANLLNVYLGVELISFPIFALIALQDGCNLAIESSLKYFILSGIASGIMLFGISLVFMSAGSLDISDIASKLANFEGGLANLGLLFMLLGLAFKLALAPLHMWSPDVYEGAPWPVIAWLSSVSKIALFIVLVRFFAGYNIVDSLPTLWRDWAIWLAVISIAVGNIVALVQYNLKRLLAYSTVAHMGFIVLPIALVGVMSLEYSLFYIITYSVALIGTAIVCQNVVDSNGGVIEDISDLKGLGQQQPLVAALLSIFIFSMAGLPPLAGFFAKFFIIKTLVVSGHIWLTGYLVLMSGLGIYYSLKVISAIYFADATNKVQYKYYDRGAIPCLLALVVLGLGCYPVWLLNWLAH